MQESYLKISVLKILSEKDQSGYNLMKHIEEAIGKKPSSGSMYPLLRSLQQQKYITNKTKERSKVYSLTSQGKSHLREILSHRQEILNKMDQSHRYFERICGQKQPGMKLIFQKILQGKAPFGAFTTDAIHFRDTLFKVTQQDLSVTQQQKIKTLIQKTTREIDSICKKS